MLVHFNDTKDNMLSVYLSVGVEHIVRRWILHIFSFSLIICVFGTFYNVMYKSNLCLLYYFKFLARK